MTATADLVDDQWKTFVATLGAALREADDDAQVWSRPTRLAGWTVEDLARHVHWGMSLEIDSLDLVTDLPGTATRARGRHHGGPAADLLPALDRCRRDLTARLRTLGEPSAEDPRLAPMPYGDLPVALAAAVFTMEAAMHTSDLLHALRGEVTLEPAAVPACATFLQAFWPVLAASAPLTPAAGTTVVLEGPTVRVASTYDGEGWGPATEEPSVVLRGDDVALMLVAFGRLTSQEAGLVVSGQADLASRLKDLVPGP